MPADYSKFRTPFAQISIGDAKGKNMTPLPPQIARLVEKVEVMETLCCNSFNQITVTFNEGSREPYSIAKDQFAPNDIYPSGGDGLLSNQSGSLVDLRMTSGGLTSSVAGALASITQAIQGTLGAINSITSLLGKDNSPPEPIVEVENKPIPADPDIQFLLQQRNQIHVAWGYKEDPLSVRCARGYIMIVTSEFPEKGTPKTTVVAHSADAIADQLVTKKGKHFGLEIPAGISESGLPLLDVQDLPPKVMIENLCLSHGLDCVVSNEFETPEFEETKATCWMSGESLHQFFNRLARRYNAVYKILTNPCTGKDTIVFINENEWQKYPALVDQTLLTYRGNGSLIKSINIRADYGKGVGVFLQAINEEGGIVVQESKSVKHPIALYEKNQDNDPLSSNTPAIAEMANGMAGEGVTANTAVTAESAPSSMKGIGGSETDKQGSSIVALDFSTLGYTKITPGNAPFAGIGNRYSGFYNIQNVTHTIDSQGYSCKGFATSFKNSQGGVSPDAPQDKIKETIEVPLFEAKSAYNSKFINNGQGSIPGISSLV